MAITSEIFFFIIFNTYNIDRPSYRPNFINREIKFDEVMKMCVNCIEKTEKKYSNFTHTTYYNDLLKWKLEFYFCRILMLYCCVIGIEIKSGTTSWFRLIKKIIKYFVTIFFFFNWISSYFFLENVVMCNFFLNLNSVLDESFLFNP